MKRTVLLTIGYLLLAPCGYFALMTGLVAPPPAPLIFGLLWIAAVAVAIRRRDKPLLVLAIPFIFFASLLLMLTLGDVFLGWTA